MKTIIKGKIVTNKLSLDNGLETVTNADGVEERRYVRKPVFNIEKETEYQQIGEDIDLVGDTNSIFISNRLYGEYIRLDRDTEVRVIDKYYQHDIGANVILVGYVIEEKTEYVSGTEDELAEHLQDYKFQCIEDDEELKTYVKVHNIDLEAVELDDLIKVVRGDKETKAVSRLYVSSAANSSLNDAMESVLSASAAMTLL